MEKNKQSVAKKDLGASVKEMMDDKAFLKIIPDMLDASKAAIKVGVMRRNKEMVDFNSMCVALMEAILKKDEKAAIAAAEKMVAAGYGEAFGLEGGSSAVANIVNKNKLLSALLASDIAVTSGKVRLCDILSFVVESDEKEEGHPETVEKDDEQSEDWNEEKLKAASEAIAKKCMGLHKGDSAWNPLCAQTLAKDLEQSLGFINAVKLTQAVEEAWKDKKRDLESLSAAIKATLSEMKMKSKA